MAFKELPDEVKGVPLEVEGSVNQQTQHHKSAYRQVRFDFYKEDGFCEDIEPIQATADHKKKQRKLI